MGLIILYWCQPYTALRYPVWECILQSERESDCSSACASVCVYMCVCFSPGSRGSVGCWHPQSPVRLELKSPRGTLCCWLVQLDGGQGTRDCPSVSESVPVCLRSSFKTHFGLNLCSFLPTCLSSLFRLSCLSPVSHGSPSDSFPLLFLLSESHVNIFVYT